MKSVLIGIITGSFGLSASCILIAALVPKIALPVGLTFVGIFTGGSGLFFLAGVIAAGILIYKTIKKKKELSKYNDINSGRISNSRGRYNNIDKIKKHGNSKSYITYGIKPKNIIMLKKQNYNNDNYISLGYKQIRSNNNDSDMSMSSTNYSETGSNISSYGKKYSRRNSIDSSNSLLYDNSVKREINFSSLERFGLTKRPTSLIHCKNGIRNIQNEVSKLKRTNSESFLLKQSIEKLGSLPSNNKKNTINIKTELKECRRSNNQNSLVQKLINKANLLRDVHKNQLIN